MRSPSDRSSAESADLILDSNVPGCTLSGNARSNRTVELSSGTTGPDSPSTRTSETSTKPPNKSTSSAEDSPVSPSVSPAKVSRRKTRAGSGLSSPELLGYYDHATSSWRTSLDFASEGSEMSSETWPLSGMTRNGTLWRLPRLPRLTFDNVSSLLPTPVTCNYGSNVGGANGRVGKVRYSLTAMAKNGLLGLWPTPGARLGTARGPQPERYFNPARSNDLDDAVAAMGDSGPLNPAWVEWLMGFPPGWTDCVLWETPSSHKSRKQSDA